MNGFASCPETNDTFCARVHDIFPPQVGLLRLFLAIIFFFIGQLWSLKRSCLHWIRPEGGMIQEEKYSNSFDLTDWPESCLWSEGLQHLRVESWQDGLAIRSWAQRALLCQTWTSTWMWARLWGDSIFRLSWTNYNFPCRFKPEWSVYGLVGPKNMLPTTTHQRCESNFVIGENICKGSTKKTVFF